MMRKRIQVSSAADSQFFFHVVDVDHELRLYQDQDGLEIFDAQAGDPPHECPLDVSSRYLLRYNNNDGGPGRLHFEVLEARDVAVVRYRVDLAAIHATRVIELMFWMHRDAAVAPPARR